MSPSQGNRAFLGVGREAPPPSGPEDEAFRAEVLRQARAPTFRFRVRLWSRLTGRGPFDWQRFERLLDGAEFRRFANWREAAQSLGWFGRGPNGNWLFAVAGWSLPFYGPSAIRHELFHAAQDIQAGLLDQPPSLLRSVLAEYSAHFWGGPLIGIPLAYGGSLFIVWAVMYIVVTVLGTLFSIP